MTTPTTIDRATYDRLRRHNYAGPASELALEATKQRYAEIGATHWRLTLDGKTGATVLEAVTISDP